MPEELFTLLGLLILLQVKHVLADYFMQTQRMLTKRSEYAHVGRAQHVGIHAVLSLLAALVVGLPGIVALVFFVVDAVLHFHIDWLKGVHSERAKDGPDTKGYWRAFGLDQLAHQLTYIVLIWIWLGMFAG